MKTKAIEILSGWVSSQETHLEILIDRRDTRKKWSEVEGKEHYYKPRYEETKLQIEEVMQGIAECENALILLLKPIVPTE